MFALEAAGLLAASIRLDDVGLAAGTVAAPAEHGGNARIGRPPPRRPEDPEEQPGRQQDRHGQEEQDAAGARRGNGVGHQGALGADDAGRWFLAS